MTMWGIEVLAAFGNVWNNADNKIILFSEENMNGKNVNDLKSAANSLNADRY